MTPRADLYGYQAGTNTPARPHLSAPLPPAAPVERPALPGARRRPGPCLLVASLGVFMAFVDATIVNIAFPDIARSFPGESVASLSWVLNAYNIVFAAFLLAGGQARRPARPPADLPRRARDLHRWRPRCARSRRRAGRADRVPRAPGGRRRARRARLAGAGARGVPGRAPRARRRAVQRDRRARRRHRPVARRPARLGVGLAARLPRQRARRASPPTLLARAPPGREPRARPPPRARPAGLARASRWRSARSCSASSRAEDWGWTEPARARLVRRRASRSARCSCAARAATARRCSSSSLLRSRTFAASNAMTIVASAGFYGYTLCNVLFLTACGTTRRSRPASRSRPGPFVAAAVAGPTSRLAERFGHRWVLVARRAASGARACSGSSRRSASSPDFVGEWLPGMVLLGIGAGATFPNLSGAAVASAPGESFGTATGLNSVARQVGAALGVAIVVAIIGMPSPLEAAAAFDRAWTFCALALFVAGARLPARRPDRRPGRRVAQPVARRARRSRVLTVPERRSTPARVRAGAARAGRRRGRRRRAAARVDERLPRARAAVRGPATPLLRDAVAGRATHGAAAPPARRCSTRATPATRSTSCAPGASRSSTRRRLGAARDRPRRMRSASSRCSAGSPRALTVRAARASDLIRIVPRPTSSTLLHEAPELSIALNRTLAEQLRERRAAPVGRAAAAATIALVAARRRRAGGAIAFALDDALGAHARVTMLRRHARSHAPAGRRRRPPPTAPLLDRAEAANDQVRARRRQRGAATTRGPTSACSRPTASSRSRPAARPSPAVAGRPELRGCDLVGWDVAARLRRARRVDRRRSIRSRRTSCATTDLQAGIDRLARRLAGRSVGIVLSGGGARGFSHIGVLEELLDARHPDRPRRRRLDGRVHRRDVRDGHGPRGDRRPLLRRVGAPQPADATTRCRATR